ncbi:GGDEF/EAL domain-containing response regulator [Geomonas sp.]|uniref:GGDEF/EAL domain-containing response regulator n=1 Tax=Geomonas sp. TaxID=2651584 RepID=UPI002B4909E6|nr:EAL domain-containing protein [Geomonas sp.]HJV35790.1 EAL domain-containing protein [Geomonas sp.]
MTYGNMMSEDTRYKKPQYILIVDDEPHLRSSLRLLLKRPGRVITECDTGGEAISILKSREIDLVLLDINLPDISGLEVAEWITSGKIPTSVIMVSADNSIDSAIRAMRSGAVEFVRKPSELEEIRFRVDNALQRRYLERSHLLIAARLEQSERMHRFLVEKSPDLIYTLDPDGRFTFTNDRFESLLGYSRDELMGCKYTTIVHEEDIPMATYAFMERRRDHRATTNLELRLKCKKNPQRNLESQQVVAILSAIGIYETKEKKRDLQAVCYAGTYGVARDITERKIAEETINFQALHDQLTLLPNRRLFKDRLELAMAQSRRNGKMVAVMFLDLDRFKRVNDTHGHTEGDELLKKVAQRLQKCIRASDTLARQGGDEFTFLLPDLLQPEGAEVIAGKIMEELKEPFAVAGQEFHVMASIGIAVYPRDGDTADQLLKHADIAMYEVKANGKSNYTFFIPEMNACYHERISLENELRQAVPNGEFELYYQPQISVRRNRIVGMEALLRWRHPVHGLLNPGSFIDMAEESGFISEITDWVLAEVCRQLAVWRDMELGEFRVSVNVSPKEFTQNNVVDRISANVIKYGLPENVLEVEITENLPVEDVSGVIDKMRLLRDRGIRISIDDFGTRYSSLNYLRRFPINAIKIDQSFVRDLSEEKNSTPIIHAIIGVARGFGLNLVAEGVETEYQMRTLHELGCDEMQGFLFSRPVPAAEVERFVRRSLSGSEDDLLDLRSTAGQERRCA